MSDTLSAAGQIYFHGRLATDRQRILEPLEPAIASIDPVTLAAQVADLVPSSVVGNVLAKLAQEGISPALVFPTPLVIEAEPTVLGYYRSLLGTSKKSFYSGDRGAFRSVEDNGTFTPKHRAGIEDLCREMAVAIADLVDQVPTLALRDLLALPLLTMGVQYDGARRVAIGQAAESDVFKAILAALGPSATRHSSTLIRLTNAAGRKVRIVKSSDPDIKIEAGNVRDDTWELLVATEIKGGTDESNAYNRSGEAEKSHLKTPNAGAHWTIMGTGRDHAKIVAGSPTTDEWFDVPQIRKQSGADWTRFKARIAAVVGI